MVYFLYQQTDDKGNKIPNTGNIFSSKDYGKTWKKMYTPENTWDSVAISNKGNISVATAWGNGIYVNKCKKNHHCHCHCHCHWHCHCKK